MSLSAPEFILSPGAMDEVRDNDPNIAEGDPVER